MDTVFRKDTDNLWEEMLQQTRRIRADATPHAPAFAYAAARTAPFSNAILPPR